MNLDDTANPERLFRILVTLQDCGDRRTLSRLASVFGRRGLEVLDAELSPTSHGTRTFSASFIASPARATTLGRTFLGLAHVVGTELSDAGIVCESPDHLTINQ